MGTATEFASVAWGQAGCVRIGKHWNAAAGVENPGNDRYCLFHAFPQRTFTGELTYRW